ncbi:hypothetical protein BDF20DRAFT_845304, partial [Mycotypha africana]|uniref:uncharacterized protein n=1 Tax=Mycotypha africana TaxID=64632 RepID=UPI0023007270
MTVFNGDAFFASSLLFLPFSLAIALFRSCLFRTFASWLEKRMNRISLFSYLLPLYSGHKYEPLWACPSCPQSKRVSRNQ